jgi:beta-lactamase class A
MSTIDTVLGWISAETPVAENEVSHILGESHSQTHVASVTDFAEAIRMSVPEVISVREEPAERLVTVGIQSLWGIRGEIYVTTSPLGRLDGLRMAALIPDVCDAASLRDALKSLDPDASVFTRSGATIESDGAVKAVSSLLKIFVQLCVSDAINRGSLNLATLYRVKASDLSHLSAGLSTDHIGSELSIADLCRLMIVRSDNSAMDILLDILGRSAVLATMERCGVAPELNSPLRSTRELFEAAWGHSADSSAHGPASTMPAIDSDLLRTTSLHRAAHSDGFDYYAPLSSVDTAMELLSTQSWSPWASVGTALTNAVGRDRAVQFKGGSAPGVLAASWHQRRGRVAHGVGFAINSRTPLGALEEIYALTCAEELLQTNGILTT